MLAVTELLNVVVPNFWVKVVAVTSPFAVTVPLLTVNVPVVKLASSPILTTVSALETVVDVLAVVAALKFAVPPVIATVNAVNKLFALTVPPFWVYAPVKVAASLNVVVPPLIVAVFELKVLL